MSIQLGATAPDFQADTTDGPIEFHDWIGDSWAVLFSHPKDFTPVCTTELGYMAEIKPEFDRRGVKILGLSVDPIDKHDRWADDIEETQGSRPNYPIIGDDDFVVSKLYGMLGADASGDPADRTAADNQTVRNVFVIGPDKKVKLVLVYPMTTGRNFDEVLRVIDSLQLTASHKVSTPVNWQQGEDVIIAGSVSNEEARELFGSWKEPKPYIRIVPQPNGRRPDMRTVYTSGTWKPSPGREEAFVEAWQQFASWASLVPGAGRLLLTRDLHEEGRYVSFGDWSREDAVRAWKGSPEFKERMAQVLQHVAEFQPAELALVATAEDGAVDEPPPTVHYENANGHE
jgi:thioredoxin-dependent peroxiredoxin